MAPTSQPPDPSRKKSPMKPEDLHVLYLLLSVLDMPTVKTATPKAGVTPEELIQATNALAKETGNDTLFVSEDFKDHLPD